MLRAVAGTAAGAVAGTAPSQLPAVATTAAGAVAGTAPSQLPAAVAAVDAAVAAAPPCVGQQQQKRHCIPSASWKKLIGKRSLQSSTHRFDGVGELEVLLHQPCKRYTLH